MPYLFYSKGTLWTVSHDVMAAILVSQNNETAGMLVSQTSPVGVMNCFLMQMLSFNCSDKFAQMLAT